MPKTSKTPAPLRSGQSVSEAFATILKFNFDYLLTWEQAARSWEQIEGVHQSRVTLRRMRSALSLFRNALPKTSRKYWSEELRWVAGELGMARDMDVLISESLASAAEDLPLSGAQGLMQLAERRRAQAYQEQVCPMLDSDRYRSFKEGFQAWIDNRQWENEGPGKKQSKLLASNMVRFSRDLMDKQERKVLAAGSHVDRLDAKAMHSLRIECKKLRYAAEFFSPLFEGMDDFILQMKGLQDLLGLMNDVAVMRQLLDNLLADVSDHEILVYAGGLVGWRTCDYRHMLNRFDLYWEEFLEAKHPWWKKSALVQQPD